MENGSYAHPRPDDPNREHLQRLEKQPPMGGSVDSFVDESHDREAKDGISGLGEAEYYAHSGNRAGSPPELLREHLELVARRAADYAERFGAKQEAYAAGLLHDLGKYSPLFLKRLRNEINGLDHWSAGALALLGEQQYLGLSGAMAILGHHLGLECGTCEDLIDVLKRIFDGRHPHDLTPTEQNVKVLVNRFRSDFQQLPSHPAQPFYDSGIQSVAGMLDIRMLFSALVDADFIETEAHFEGLKDGTKQYRPSGPDLQPEKALEILLEHLRSKRVSTSKSVASEEMLALRKKLLDDCLKAAEQPPGLFTLTAPTGSGKTLSMLAFALAHAHAYRKTKRRIVVVIPYLSIIEQTVRVYRELFSQQFGSQYILEHDSLAGIRGVEDKDQNDNEDSARRTERLLAENWDAPIIITTSVQCLESLFANRPSTCRKLHRLAQSIILFDEVQTLPQHLIHPTLAALSRLAERYQTTVVFSTATQPAFSHLHAKVKSYAPMGWTPREIVENPSDLFTRMRRTQVTYDTTPVSWEELAEKIASVDCQQVLCILNLKRHAISLTELVRKLDPEGLYHLSTNMCSAHREAVLKEVRTRLSGKRLKKCRLISTQCVEAGVDVDFPIVYRAFGPLDAIAQAAGRCNRNDLLGKPGTVRVFSVANDGKTLYPTVTYGKASAVTSVVLGGSEVGKEIDIDINDPRVFERYYRTLYELGRTVDLSQEFSDALLRRDFGAIAQEYRLIEKDAVNVLVPYDLNVYESLKEELAKVGHLTSGWVRRARAYSISLFRPNDTNTVRRILLPVPLPGGKEAKEWFVCADAKYYDALLGLTPPEDIESWVQ